VGASRSVIAQLVSRFRLASRGEHGYVLILAMLILVAVGMATATLLMQVLVNQQHVTRDRAYTQSLAVAEAGLNQYLWMVASGKSSQSNGFAIAGNTGPDPLYKQFDLTDIYDDSVKGAYAIQVVAPTAQNSRVLVTVTGKATSSVDVPRTVTASLGRPSFSEYVLLTNDEVWIGGPLTRVWHGKTHSNAGICIDTANITDTVTSANKTYYSAMFGGTRKGVWSGYEHTVPPNDPSRALWKFPVPAISFATVTSDFARLNDIAVGNGVNLPYSTSTKHGSTQGWYIKLLPGKKYQIKRVTAEKESKNGTGGGLTLVAPSSPVPSGILSYPSEGVIYVNDNVWVEGTDVDGRLTIASSGQLNGPGKNAATSIHVVGDLTYSRKDGTVAIGLIAQNNVEIPTYAPWNKGGTVSQQDMEINVALIAQQGKEYVTAADLGGPTRDMLTIYGSVSSYGRPYRYSTGNHGGFVNGSNIYDPWLLHNPPPHFPTVGSYQILEWRELPSAQGVLPGS
jgi:Tfp pilus assembly protein PilX